MKTLILVKFEKDKIFNASTCGDNCAKWLLKIAETEDSNSGYQFFAQVCSENKLSCESMNGKSNVFHYLNKHKDEKILVIADGAAFGSEIDRVLQLIERRKNVALYLPESFEWMILSTGILKKQSSGKHGK